MYKKSTFKQLMSILMCICVIFISLSLITYIINETNHICTKEKCASCGYILKAEKILKQISNSITYSYFVVFFFVSFFSFPIVDCLNIKVITPITLKVKMIN